MASAAADRSIDCVLSLSLIFSVYFLAADGCKYRSTLLLMVCMIVVVDLLGLNPIMLRVTSQVCAAGSIGADWWNLMLAAPLPALF